MLWLTDIDRELLCRCRHEQGEAEQGETECPAWLYQSDAQCQLSGLSGVSARKTLRLRPTQ